MAEQCVVAVYDSSSKAEQAVHVLHRAGLPAEQISVIARKDDADIEDLGDLAVPDDSLRDAAVGAGMGSVLGMLIGISITAMSGVGAILAIGALSGACTGVVAGGLVGAMTGWGLHETQLAHYGEQLKEGRILVIAEGDPEQVAFAKQALEETDDVEIQLHAKTASESKEIALDESVPTRSRSKY